MRNAKLTLLTLVAVLALALGASTAHAASIDVIWQISGTATTTVTSSTIVTGNIVLTPTTPLIGAGSVIELSADSTPGVTITAAAQILNPGWIALGGAPVILNPHTENVIAQGDLLGFGAPIAGPTIIGTITVHGGLPSGGTVTVSNSGPADDIFSGPNSVIAEYVFNPGTVVVPEPTTVSLLGLGLIGLTLAGRRNS